MYSIRMRQQPAQEEPFGIVIRLTATKAFRPCVGQLPVSRRAPESPTVMRGDSQDIDGTKRGKAT